MALRTLTELVERAKEKFGALEMSIVHRVGRVPVRGDSVVLGCAAAHRSEAFAACAWAMDEVKRIVPIWKTEAGSRRPRAKPDGNPRGRPAAPRKVPCEIRRGPLGPPAPIPRDG